MSRPLLVFEDINAVPRRRLFSIRNVSVMATPYAWLSLPFFCVLGFLISSGLESEDSLMGRIVTGLGFGLLLSLTNTIHSAGHLVAAGMVGAPMETLLLTSTRDVTLYHQGKARPSKWMFIGRSLGGPIANFAAGGVLFGLWYLSQIRWFLFFSGFNLAIGLWTLCPIPSMDGWVIWGELFGFRRKG